MQHNPYAPPTAGPTPPGTPPTGGGPLPWEIGEVLGIGLEAFKRHWPVLVFAPLIVMIVTQVPAQLPSVLQLAGVLDPGSPIWLPLTLGSFVISWFISAFFQVGLIRLFVVAARGQEPDFALLFSGADRLFPFFVLLIVFVFSLSLGLMLCLVPGVILLCGFFLAQYQCADGGLGPIASLEASWRATSGQRVQIFLFLLAVIGLAIAGILLCCVGYFVAIPIAYVAWAAIYLRLTGQQTLTVAGQPPAPAMPT